LFPNDPKRRLEVWWSDPTARKDIHLIVIGGQSTWAAPGGFRPDFGASGKAQSQAVQAQRFQ
jgi:hypothetical protein